MANFVDVEGKSDNATAHGVHSESETVKWLKKHNLHRLIPKFNEERMTLDELLEYGEDIDTLKEYLTQLGIAAASITRICFKIKKELKENKKENKPNVSATKIVKIVLSQDEDDAMSRLSAYNAEISSLLDTLTSLYDKIIENEKDIKAQINAEFENIHDLLKKRKQDILGKLKTISEEKQSKINNITQQMQETQEITEKTMKTCDDLIENGAMDKYKRKKEILSMVNDIINKKLPQSARFPTKIAFVFDKNSVNTFLSNLGDVYGAESHPIPVINNVETKSITWNEHTIHWCAALKESDLKHKSKNKLFMKLENVNDDIEEKEKDLLHSSLIVFNANKKQYQYKMDKLKRNTLYKMRLCLFEAKQNDLYPLETSVSLHFKTKDGYDIDKQFVYKSDFDENGICYFIGTRFGKQQWTNPAKQGLIVIKSNGWAYGDGKMVVGRTPQKIWTRNERKKAWFSVDFKSMKIKPTAYALRRATGMTGWISSPCLRTWNLEGSNDGTNWSVIKKHKNDKTLQRQGQAAMWSIEGCNDAYSIFRVKMMGEDSTGHWHLTGSGFEIYGHLFGNI